jgi:hypothetical protein
MKHRRKLATDLRKLSDVILKYFPTADTGTLQNAITELLNKDRIPLVPGERSDSNIWGYTLQNIIFKFDRKPDDVVPTNCKDLKLILDIKVLGNCNDLNTLRDPFKWLEFNIVIEGTKFTEEKNEQLLTSYHLDKHIQATGDGDPEHPHPIYHFHFGGRKLIEHIEQSDFQTGGVLLFDSPRMSHYPMEAILGVDFTISNFFPNVWKKIKSESNEYNNLIEEYQNLFLKPYIQTHASQWNYIPEDLAISSFWNPTSICPQIHNS